MAFFKQGAGAPEPGRYGALLIVLIVGYLLSAFIDARWVEAAQVVLFTVAMLLALRSAAISRRVVRVLLLAAIIGLPVMFVLSFSKETGDIGTEIANISTGMALLAAAELNV